jgi:predicted alpha/beta-hydrolase family hydrolase
VNKVTTPEGKVSLVVDGDPGGTLVVLGHGAGADLDSEFMRTIAIGLAERGIATARFNFVYTELGKKRPDPQPRLEATFGGVIDHVLDRLAPANLFLGGKSMGGRIASHVAIGRPEVRALAFLGYPLHPPGRPERIRDAHLHDLKVPMLFVEGTRDPFCPLDTLERVRAGLAAPTEVAVIGDGDHSFKVRKSSGRSTPEAWGEAVAAVSDWIARTAG